MDTQNTLAPPAAAPTSIRSVGVGQGVSWIAEGFKMVFKFPGTWVLITIGLCVLVLMVSAIGSDTFGSALSMGVSTFICGVLMRSCQAAERGEDMFKHVGDTAKSSQLVILSLLATAMYFAMIMLIYSLGVGAAVMALIGSPMLALKSLGVGGLGIFAIYILISMAMMFSPPLVVLDGVAPVEALKLSFTACLKNIIPFLLYTVLVMLVMIVAAIPLGLGLLIAMPAYICAGYIAYKDIFKG